MTDEENSDSWERGNPYEQYVGRWSRRVAPAFLDWLQIPPGLRWLDVGCGTGALSASILDRCNPKSVIGIDPSDGFLETARENLQSRAELYLGDATSLPLADASVDVVVSGLVLNFVPDPLLGLKEMARVTASGGTVAAYVWDYSGKMELMRYFWDVAVEQNSAAQSLDEGVRFPLCNASALEELFTGELFEALDVRGVEIATPFENFEDYWQPFLGGQGPAPAYAMSLSEADRNNLRSELKARIPSQSDGSISMNARVWAVRSQIV